MNPAVTSNDPVPRLVSEDGTRVFRLDGDRWVVGRGAECEIRIDDPDVSRRHARLVLREDGLLVEDLGSKNGTLVDGVRVEGPTLAGPRARISFGGPVFVVHHPAAEVTRMLADAGEPTVTRMAAGSVDRAAAPRSLVVPAVVALLLAVVLATLLW